MHFASAMHLAYSDCEQSERTVPTISKYAFFAFFSLFIALIYKFSDFSANLTTTLVGNGTYKTNSQENHEWTGS